LLVGLNYTGTKNELAGCQNDIRRVQKLLATLGFAATPGNQLVLLDEPGSRMPTLQNLREGIRWLVGEARPGDALYFHYSGHGGRKPRRGGLMSGDKYHETLVPLDSEQAGCLLDDELFDTLVRPVPAGCRLTCVFDSCHSGGVLNLPYYFLGSRENLQRALRGEAMQLVGHSAPQVMADIALAGRGKNKGAVGLRLLMDLLPVCLGFCSLWKRWQQSKNAGDSPMALTADGAKNVGQTRGEVVEIAGCRSDQTSADVANVGHNFNLRQNCSRGAGAAGGVLTSALIEVLQEASGRTGDLNFLSLLERMRTQLEERGYSQVPQLCSTAVLDLEQTFSLVRGILSAPEMEGDAGPWGSLGGKGIHSETESTWPHGE